MGQAGSPNWIPMLTPLPAMPQARSWNLAIGQVGMTVVLPVSR